MLLSLGLTTLEGAAKLLPPQVPVAGEIFQSADASAKGLSCRGCLQTSLKRRRGRPGCFAGDPLALQKVLGDSVCHAVDVPEPAKPALREQSQHARDPGASDDF